MQVTEERETQEWRGIRLVAASWTACHGRQNDFVKCAKHAEQGCRCGTRGEAWLTEIDFLTRRLEGHPT